MKNKILSLILTVTMLCSAFSFVNVTVEASGTAWDGTAATNFDGGMGTQYDPYQISTAEQFKLFANIVNGVDLEGTVFMRDVSVCAVLTADIVLNAGSNSDTSDWREWTPI